MKCIWAMVLFIWISVSVFGTERHKISPNSVHPPYKMTQGSTVAPNISYAIPSAIMQGSTVSYMPTNTGGAIYADGDAGLLAGSGVYGAVNGNRTTARFASPAGLVRDALGNIFVADTWSHSIRKITPDGTVSTFVGGVGGSADGVGTAAKMYLPSYLAIDAADNLYVTDRGNHRVRKITPAGVVTTFVGSTQGFVNGTGTAARFNGPLGIAIDAAGNFYVADEGNKVIRKITPSGVVTTLAGTGASGSVNGPGHIASFESPRGIAVGLDGIVYVADYSGNRIRKVSPTGVVSTLAGTGVAGSNDGSTTSTTLNQPIDLAVDESSLVYVVSMDNKVRRIYPWGTSNTLAGTGTAGYANGAPNTAMFNSPGGILLDKDGTLYVGDTGNNRIRTVGGGYTIDPVLPAGLSFNKTTGVISGTPTTISGSTTYVVTAHNSMGASSFTFGLSVIDMGDSADRTHMRNIIYREPFTTPPLSPTIEQASRQVNYIDGLGRPLQDVVIQGSPMQHDLIKPYAYDSLGRQSFQYLPYSRDNNQGTYRVAALSGEQQDFYSSPPEGVASTTHPYSHAIYEQVSGARIKVQGEVGEIWQPTTSANRTQKMLYGSNGSNQVRYWTLTANGAVSTYYEAGKLRKQTFRDENWGGGDGNVGAQEVFQDQSGRVVMAGIWETDQIFNATSYIYDNRGRLRYILPPAARMNGTSERISFAESDAFFADQVYAYRYDDSDRPIARKMPGKGWEYFIYNKLDQVVATQDAVQRTKSPQQWTVAKYDALGRNILTGIYRYGSASGLDYRSVLQDSVYNGSQFEVKVGTGYGYSSQSWPRSAIETMLSLTYYDSHNIPGLPAAYLPSGYNTNTQGLPTAARVKVLDAGNGTNTMLWMVNHYDDEGRPIRQFRQHYKGGVHSSFNYDEVVNTYNFTHQPLTSMRKHYTGTSSAVLQVQVLSEYDYDHSDRLLRIWKTTGTGPRTQISGYSYNELGQVRTRGLHSTNNGNSFGQIETLGYNERGWLTLDSTALLVRRLRYQENLSGVTPQYNGRISRQEWQHNGQTSQQYTYMYDGMGRLRSGLTASGTGESVRYDRMGNIDTLWQDGGAARKYHYVNASNRVNNITGGLNTGSYTYDANGNTVYDGRLGKSLRYNTLGLVDSVGGSPAIRYTYDAWGRKLRTAAGTIAIDYVDGIEWVGGSLMSIEMEEGRIINTGSGYRYEYHLRDHLGSLRSAFRSDQLTAASQRADYTPFGRRHTTGQLAGNPVNRYLYSNKELQDGTELYDYGARQYDPVTGRWGAIDPLADAYVGMTPYGFVGNDPINYLDPDGRKIDEASSGYWYQEYMSWRGAIGQAEEDLAGLMERHESGEEGLSTPITTLKGVLAKAYQYIGLLETLASSATTYTHASGGWSILMDEVVVDRGQNANSGATSYYEDPAFYVNGTLGFAGVGLAVKGEMWKTNELWHIQKNGRVRTAWSSLRNNNFVKSSKDISLSKTAGLRSFSNKVAVASLVVTGYGIATTGVIKPSDVLNATMAGISFTGVGSLVSGAYFLTDFGFTVVTGKGLGQRLDESIGTYKAW
ncbi:DUF6443 domain-containing protein [Sphingobacterium alkalisoli]|nr:DUF6443 domain-containing protein [Sphingobacterium alkalisoli]